MTTLVIVKSKAELIDVSPIGKQCCSSSYWKQCVREQGTQCVKIGGYWYGLERYINANGAPDEIICYAEYKRRQQ